MSDTRKSTRFSSKISLPGLTAVFSGVYHKTAVEFACLFLRQRPSICQRCVLRAIRLSGASDLSDRASTSTRLGTQIPRKSMSRLIPESPENFAQKGRRNIFSIVLRVREKSVESCSRPPIIFTRKHTREWRSYSQLNGLHRASARVLNHLSNTVHFFSYSTYDGRRAKAPLIV